MMYVGSLHDDSVKNSTHQPPASSRKPNSAGRRRAVASSEAHRKRRNGTSKSVPGSRPSSSTGP